MFFKPCSGDLCEIHNFLFMQGLPLLLKRIQVLDYFPKITNMNIQNTDPVLNNVAGFSFHNKSKFDFEKLKADSNNIAANLNNYINGFSTNAREIIEYL